MRGRATTGGNFWQNKSVLITGASSGIGWALAEHLSERGARVGLMARREDKLDELAARIRARGGEVAVAAADIGDPRRTREAVARLEHALGPCDVMIANAGVHHFSPADHFDTDRANRVITTNVQGVINAVGAVLPAMVERRSGHLVAIASVAAMLGLPEVGAYAASKAAVVTLMQSLRLDLHRYGVKVTTICPGFVDTPLIADHHRRVLLFVLSPEQAARRIARAIERGRREYWFPRRTWLLAHVGRCLPYGVYRWVCARLPRRTPRP